MKKYIDETLANAKLKEICDDTATSYGVEYGGRAEKFARLTEDIPAADVAPRSEVALEIIGEIWASHTPDIDGFFTMHECELANLKKKYTKEIEA